MTDLRFGLLAPRMSKQLENQNLDPKDLEGFDRDQWAINRLRVSGLLTTEETADIRGRLHNKIQNAIKRKKT